ncbi:hypothetical protein [Vibrio parahaemolyticus]|uniref:hypothetical protein n=1 Tax=Vibrio parahaemolyticus TaxID=670 RepID=UPI0027E3B6E2|nr:hypothetical protein [Vibrio parahaemolyticus]WMN64909.1 hypothetical protein NI388_07110 [Vibrio parahaemolyticus]WMN75547.1 hypothetical protein NI386_15185 [Vibrio parahaemolyticus]
MKHLIAFAGARSGGLHKVLSTTDEIFAQQDLTNRVAYSPSTNLDDDEWFYIEQFSEKGYENDFVAKPSPINTTTLNQLPVEKFEKIKYLCCEEGTKKYFQKLLPSQLISKKWFSVSDAPVLENNKKIISFSNTPDAIYDSASNELYFRDIAKVKAIFKGIEELYREATQEEVTEFLQQDFIELTEGYDVASVKVPNRKRIAIAVDRISDYSAEQKQEIFDYIHEYCPNVTFNDGKFSISSEDDLKYVLFGIDERYYTTKLGNEKRLANSVISMAS